MTFEQYQKEATKMAVYPDIGNNFIYPVLGLSGESGEVAERIKIVLRNKGGKMNQEDIDGLKGDLGDVLWYLSQLAQELGLNFEEVAQYNLKKLKSRQSCGVIKTEGIKS